MLCKVLLCNDVLPTSGDIGDCAKACIAYNSCNHFTYAPDSSLGYTAGECWLKYKLGIKPSNNVLKMKVWSGILY